MINIISPLLVIILVAYYFRKSKKTQDVSHDILMGVRCLSCKDIMVSEYEHNRLLIQYNTSLKFNPNINICQCCKRDESIDLVVGKKRNYIFNKIKKHVLSIRHKYIVLWLLYSIVVSVILSALLKLIFNIDIFWITNCINIIYWVTMVYKQKISSIKKEDGTKIHHI